MGRAIIGAMPTPKGLTCAARFFALAALLVGCGRVNSGEVPVVVLPSARSRTPTPATPAGFIILPTDQSQCQNGARFVEDLTLPDGSKVAPGAVLDKRWAVQNSGTCDWGPDYRLVRLGEANLGGPAEIALYPARAASPATWQVVLQAPGQPGEYRGRWQARAPDGTLFGDEVFIVVVVEAVTPTAAETAAPSP